MLLNLLIVAVLCQREQQRSVKVIAPVQLFVAMYKYEILFVYSVNNSMLASTILK